MASAAVRPLPRTFSGGSNADNMPSAGGGVRNIRSDVGGGVHTHVSNHNGGIAKRKDRDRDLRREMEISEDEVDEAEAPNTKRSKGETHVVPAKYFHKITNLMNDFSTKSTIYYSNPDAEKKRDKSDFVLWKMRTQPDGTNKLSIQTANKEVQDVIASEVSAAQQFRDIFNPNSAKRVFNLINSGQNVQSAVFQALQEMEDNDDASSN